MDEFNELYKGDFLTKEPLTKEILGIVKILETTKNEYWVKGMSWLLLELLNPFDNLERLLLDYLSLEINETYSASLKVRKEVRKIDLFKKQLVLVNSTVFRLLFNLFDIVWLENMRNVRKSLITLIFRMPILGIDALMKMKTF